MTHNKILLHSKVNLNYDLFFLVGNGRYLCSVTAAVFYTSISMNCSILKMQQLAILKIESLSDLLGFKGVCCLNVITTICVENLLLQSSQKGTSA